MDWYFTSVTIVHGALEKKITTISLMRLDRRGIPKEVKSLENSKERSVVHFFDSHEKILPVSCID